MLLVVEMVTVGVVLGLIVMVTGFEVAVVVVAHAAFEVSTQVIISLLANEVLE